MTERRNDWRSITLCIHELMRISMECLPLGLFGEGLCSDLLQFLSHTGVSQVLANKRMS